MEFKPADKYIFSIIIPTYNGRNKITHLLDSIFSCQYNFEFETIIVVDGSTDDTLDVLAPYLNKHIKIIVQQNQGRATARNRGAEKAKGIYLFFVDDDMRLSKNTLLLHLGHHKSLPNTALVGKVSMDINKLNKDFDNYTDGLLGKWEIAYNGKVRLNAANLKFTTQHLSIPNSLFLWSGGFDNRLTDAEDYDLAMRLLESNIPIYYDPSIIAWHDDFPTCSAYIKRQIEYRLSHQKLTDIGKKYEHGVFLPLASPENKIKKISIAFFSSNFWLEWVEKELLLFLPQKLRYKVYATVIYAHTLKGLKLV